MAGWSDFGFPRPFLRPYLYPFVAFSHAIAERRLMDPESFYWPPLEEGVLSPLRGMYYHGSSYVTQFAFYYFKALPFGDYLNHLELARSGKVVNWTRDSMIEELASRGFRVPEFENYRVEPLLDKDLFLRPMSVDSIVAMYVACNLLKFRIYNNTGAPGIRIKFFNGGAGRMEYDSIDEARADFSAYYDRSFSTPAVSIFNDADSYVYDNPVSYVDLGIVYREYESNRYYTDLRTLVGAVQLADNPKYKFLDNCESAVLAFYPTNAGFVGSIYSDLGSFSEGCNLVTVKRGEPTGILNKTALVEKFRSRFSVSWPSFGDFGCELRGFFDHGYTSFPSVYADISGFFQYYDDCDTVAAADFGL